MIVVHDPIALNQRLIIDSQLKSALTVVQLGSSFLFVRSPHASLSRNIDHDKYEQLPQRLSRITRYKVLSEYVIQEVYPKTLRTKNMEKVKLDINLRIGADLTLIERKQEK